MINVLVNGAKGKMGQTVCSAVKADSELSLVGEADQGDNLTALIKSTGAQAVVDFTHPSVRMSNVEIILKAGAFAVVGTTGYTPDDLKQIQAWCQATKKGCLIAPNFSIGAVLMMQFAAKAAVHMPEVEIIEFHHKAKADSPSGTAVKTAELIAEAQAQAGVGPSADPTHIWNLKESRGGDHAGIRVHAVRLPGFVASQEVILGGLGQSLTIRHDTINREAFMPGVVLALKKMQQRSDMIYGLEHLL